MSVMPIIDTPDVVAAVVHEVSAHYVIINVRNRHSASILSIIL